MKLNSEQWNGVEGADLAGYECKATKSSSRWVNNSIVQGNEAKATIINIGGKGDAKESEENVIENNNIPENQAIDLKNTPRILL